WERLELGAKVLGVVQRVGLNNAVVDIGGIESRLVIQELDYGWCDDMRDELSSGDPIWLKVTHLDKEKKTVQISRKATLENPWKTVSDRYKVGAEYLGTISGVAKFGNFIKL